LRVRNPDGHRLHSHRAVTACIGSGRRSAALEVWAESAGSRSLRSIIAGRGPWAEKGRQSPSTSSVTRVPAPHMPSASSSTWRYGGEDGSPGSGRSNAVSSVL
jgi:hypothetical protein